MADLVVEKMELQTCLVKNWSSEFHFLKKRNVTRQTNKFYSTFSTLSGQHGYPHTCNQS